MSSHPFAFTERPFEDGKLYSLPALAERFPGVARLPRSLRVVLESLLRNCDGQRVRMEDVEALARWGKTDERTSEVPFVVARVLLQDFTGVPLLVDLAAMRSATARVGKDAKVIEPLVPVDLVIDHSVQVDVAGSGDAFVTNLGMEFSRNKARYEFLKWGTQAFESLQIVPPGIGICHQVNLELLAKGVLGGKTAPGKDGAYYPDTLVGTDSHTTMINGLGIVGWGVGGIEAEAGMLGQPVYFLVPDVVGLNLYGSLNEGVTATDLVLHVTELLRKARVVGKFVEFHGAGAAALPATTRATLANMAPEYGATMGFFPVDEATCAYFESTGRTAAEVERVRAYYQAQQMWGVPAAGECDYTQVLDLDLRDVVPALAGPKRPQDRVALTKMAERFATTLAQPTPDGYGKPLGAGAQRFPIRAGAGAGTGTGAGATLGHGDVVIAAITSCTNTSNPSVMIAAGLVAKKAVLRGLGRSPLVKASLAPGSRVVTEYLAKTGLQPYLDQLGFHLVGYGCTTCIGNSGPLDPSVEEAISANDVVTASVLSGNRNFEARVHQSVKANYLASPPLVVAYAIAGSVARDLTTEPIAVDPSGAPVFLRELWPTLAEIEALLSVGSDPETYRRLYASFETDDGLWKKIASPTGERYAWDERSTYIREPPYFFGDGAPDQGVIEPRDVTGARALAIFGDSITTDHISPAGAIKATSPAGQHLVETGITPADFNSYGARRGNHEVMVRGTFANVRIKNLMVPGVEGGVTVQQPLGRQTSIYQASLAYLREGTPLVILAGEEYGTGSSRDWAAKGTRLLGVKVVVAKSFERIHRSNLVGMGVLPCQFDAGTGADTLRLDGSEIYDLVGIAGVKPRQRATLAVRRKDGTRTDVPVTVRIDTPIEVEYFRHGGILPYVLRQLLG